MKLTAQPFGVRTHRTALYCKLYIKAGIVSKKKKIPDLVDIIICIIYDYCHKVHFLATVKVLFFVGVNFRGLVKNYKCVDFVFVTK